MRVFALSDIHVDYEANAQWVSTLSARDYTQDVLILAGDVTDRLRLLRWCLSSLAERFKQVLFVPGNHELWVVREGLPKNSLEKFAELQHVVEDCGVSMRPFREGGLSIVPLLGWYDYSFGNPSEELQAIWMDYRACRWPAGFEASDIAAHFESLNPRPLSGVGDTVITFSHFLPRIDLMPAAIPVSKRILYPILGTTRLERQLRSFSPTLHVYGHSHVNRRKEIDGVTYINNAFGYPSETGFTSRQISCIYER